MILQYGSTLWETMTTDHEIERPHWTGRVPRHKIARLYATDAQGIVDKDLIDEVGIALYARCEAIMLATEARDGKAVCPKCESIVYHSGKSEVVECSDCSWEFPWKDYLNSTRRKQLSVGGIETFLKEFMKQFPRADTPRKKMIQIDNLLHRYHWELKGEAGRPSAVNLIGGKIAEVMEFLNDLTYSEKSAPGLKENYSRWRKRGRRTIRRIEKAKQRREAKGAIQPS